MSEHIEPAPTGGTYAWDEQEHAWIPVPLDAYGFPATPERKEALRRYRNWLWSDEVGKWVPPTPQPASIPDPENPEWIDTVFVWDDTAAAWVGVPTQPFASWVRNEQGAWVAPIPYPLEGSWVWDEASLSWVAKS